MAVLKWSGMPGAEWSVNSVNWLDESDTPTAWLSGEDAVFANGSTSINVSGQVLVNSLTFADAPSYYAVQASQSGAEVTAVGAASLIYEGQSSVTLAVTFSGNEGLTFKGGHFILERDQSYTGTTTLKAGRLDFSNTTTFASGATLSIESGATFYASKFETTTPFELNNSGTVTLMSSSVFDSNAVINNAAPGVIELQSKAAFEGAEIDNQGTIRLIDHGVLDATIQNNGKIEFLNQAPGSSGLTVVNDINGVVDLTTLSVQMGNQSVYIGDLSGAGTLKLGSQKLLLGEGIQAGEARTFSGVITGPTMPSNLETLHIRTAGTLTLSGNNTYSGTTLVETGTLVLDSLNAAGTSIVNVKDGASLQLESDLRTGLTVLNYGTTTLAENVKVEGISVVTNHKGGEFEVTTSAAGDTQGLAINNYGALRLDAKQGAAAELNSIQGDGTVQLVDGQWTLGGTNASDMSGVVFGEGALRASGAYDVTLSATNTFTGGLILGGGTVILNNALAAGMGDIVFETETSNTLVIDAGSLSNTIFGLDGDDIIDLQGFDLDLNADWATALNIAYDDEGHQATITLHDQTMVLNFDYRFIDNPLLKFSKDSEDGSLLLALDIPNAPPTITGVPETPVLVTVGRAVDLEHFTVADADTAQLTITLTPVNGRILGIGTNAQGVATYSGTAEQINNYLTFAMFRLEAAGTGSIEISLSDGVNVVPTTTTYHFTTAVTTPPVTPPVVTPTPVDGVPVLIDTGSDGQQRIVVPVVTRDRDEDLSTPNSKLADIAVVKNSAGVTLLNVGLPVGTGLTANGPATPVSGINALTLLDGRITSASGTAEQKASAQAFLSSLPADTQVAVQSVTVTAQDSTGGPLVINAVNLDNGHKTVVVVDTRSLPADTLIELHNIDFAVIVGNARVTGGSGANVAYGDDDHQFIVLGEGDDIVHGLGGNDTVGSLRGNDQVFGDAGDDIVYGGSGDDILTGGTGNDAMNGGFGFDTAVQSGVRTDYTLKVENHSIVLTHLRSGEVDRFTDVERITFDSGKAIVVAHEATDVADLKARFATDELIELNFTRAVPGTDANDVVTPTLGVALNIDLGAGQDVVKLAGGRSDVHLDVEAGQIVHLTRLEDGAMLGLKNTELLAFDNGDVTVLAQNHDQAIVGRAYELLLGRNVDVEGFQFWADALNAGVSLQNVLQLIVTSQEAADVYKLANGNFIEQLYMQGLDRASDAAGKAYWADALFNGVSRAVVLEGFAGAAEAVEVIGSTVDVNVVS